MRPFGLALAAIALVTALAYPLWTGHGGVVVLVVLAFVVAVLLVGARTASRHRDELTRTASRALLDAFGNTGHAVVALDGDLRVTHVNRAAGTLFGRGSDAILGSSLWSVLPHARATLQETLATVARTGSAARLEYFDAPLDVWLDVQAQKVAGGLAVSLDDVTVRKRTEQRLATQYAVARILAEATDLDDASARVLEAIGGSLGWGVGAVWQLDPSADLLDCIALWEAPDAPAPEFAAATRAYRFPRGIGLPGRVWESARPHWIRNLIDDRNFPRAAKAASDGLHSAFAFPIFLGGQVHGVVEFFSREIRRPDEPLLAQVAAIGNQIGQFIERTRAEEGRRRSEERLRLAVEAGAMGTFDWDVVTSDITWSAEMERLHGLEPGTFDRTLDDVLACIHPDDREHVRERIAQDLLQGKADEIEYRSCAPDGTVRWLFSKATIFRDATGAAVRITGVAMDMTERKRLEDAQAQLLAIEQAGRAAAEAAERRAGFLAEASAVLASSLEYETNLTNLARLAVRSIADWCVADLVEADGRIRRLAIAHPDPALVERAWEIEQRLPFDRGAPPGPAAVIRTGHSTLATDIDEPALARGARDPIELEFLGGLGLTSAVCVPLRARGLTLGALTFASAQPERRYGPTDLAVAEDLARRAAVAIDSARLYRSAQEANRVKDEFLATLSHELRTPLSAILSWTRILRSKGLDDASAARGLETIERNTRLQAQLIEDLLDVSRIITGKLHLEHEPVDLGSVVEAAVETVRPAAEAKGIPIAVAVDPTAGFVSGDPDRLQQIVWNLLANAIKFTPREGRVRVEVARDGTEASVRVTDTGKGIPAAFLPHIFERFRQADSSSTRNHGGLGLGLAIVRHLVDLHGGSVHADSPGEDQGATFFVRLPLAPLQLDGAEIPAVRPLPAFESAPSLAGLDILIVDDDPDARESLALTLEAQGAAVTAVDSAAGALAAFARRRPDVLVSDIAMPGIDGYGLIGRVREAQAGDGREVPALALSAYAREEDRRRALDAGFQMHVAKPVDPVRLTQLVAQLAGRA